MLAITEWNAKAYRQRLRRKSVFLVTLGNFRHSLLLKAKGLGASKYLHKQTFLFQFPAMKQEQCPPKGCSGVKQWEKQSLQLGAAQHSPAHCSKLCCARAWG